MIINLYSLTHIKTKEFIELTFTYNIIMYLHTDIYKVYKIQIKFRTTFFEWNT